jgi:hypothetical protein
MQGKYGKRLIESFDKSRVECAGFSSTEANFIGRSKACQIRKTVKNCSIGYDANSAAGKSLKLGDGC